MKILLIKYWFHLIAIVVIVLLLSTLFGPCNKPKSFKEDKEAVDSTAAKLARLQEEKNKTIDSLVTISAKSMRVIDSLVKEKRATEKNLQAEKTEAERWQWQYTLLINQKDTAGALATCDSIITSNTNLIGLVSHYQQLYDSTVATYDKQLTDKDNIIEKQVEVNNELRSGFNDINKKYTTLYNYNAKLAKRYTWTKAKGKILAGTALAGVTYFLIDILKK